MIYTKTWFESSTLDSQMNRLNKKSERYWKQKMKRGYQLLEEFSDRIQKKSISFGYYYSAFVLSWESELYKTIDAPGTLIVAEAIAKNQAVIPRPP